MSSPILYVLPPDLSSNAQEFFYQVTALLKSIHQIPLQELSIDEGSDGITKSENVVDQANFNLKPYN